jgi:hypothetical protein
VVGGNTAPLVTILAPASNSAFTSTTAVGFTGSATDAEDGSLTAAMQWSSNIDGVLGYGGSISRTLRAGSHLVTASATDSLGTSRTSTVTVIVSDPAPASGVVLQASGYKVKGSPRVNLTWTLSSWPSVAVYRNGVLVTTTANDGSHTDALPKGAAGYSYQVCSAGTTTCSNSVSVTF